MTCTLEEVNMKVQLDAVHNSGVKFPSQCRHSKTILHGLNQCRVSAAKQFSAYFLVWLKLLKSMFSVNVLQDLNFVFKYRKHLSTLSCLYHPKQTPASESRTIFDILILRFVSPFFLLPSGSHLFQSYFLCLLVFLIKRGYIQHVKQENLSI